MSDEGKAEGMELGPEGERSIKTVVISFGKGRHGGREGGK